MDDMTLRQNIPLKRFGRVDDIANVVAFLASDGPPTSAVRRSTSPAVLPARYKTFG